MIEGFRRWGMYMDRKRTFNKKKRIGIRETVIDGKTLLETIV